MLDILTKNILFFLNQKVYIFFKCKEPSSTLVNSKYNTNNSYYKLINNNHVIISDQKSKTKTNIYNTHSEKCL